MLQFSSFQKESIRRGKLARLDMVNESKLAAKRVAGNHNRSAYMDSIFSGTTGIGKTYNVEKAIIDMNLPYYVIQGNMSTFAFGGNLMLLHSQKPTGLKMAVIVDDCDSFFETKDTINILKGMTGKPGSRFFNYSKKINEHSFTDAQLAVIDSYKVPGHHGFQVPTDDFVFIFTTNFQLPYEKDAKEYGLKNPGSARANRLSDLSAIRGRFNCLDYSLPKEVNWGWIAEVALNDGGLKMLKTDEERMILLDWVWNNWDNMTETNLRTIEKMAYMMEDYGDDYRDMWEQRFLIG